MSSLKGEGIYNAIVIGAGTAGLVTAAGTAGLGGRVALIERNRMGGDCLNFGCVPSKALISSARLAQQIREARKWGLRNREAQFEFRDVMERMRARRAQIAPKDSQERFESLGVDVFRGEAKFVSPHELEVVAGGIDPGMCDEASRGQRPRLRLRTHNFVIATGSRATIPKIDGIGSVRYFTNETIFDELQENPSSMIVLGGGPIGCELGQAFARLGVRVTILQSGPQLLPPEDEDVGELLLNQFRAEKIVVKLNATVERVLDRNGRIEVQLADENPILGETLLIAAGRTPNLRALDLEAAKVEYDEHGVKVNEYLQTSQPHIYATGDVTNRLKFTHTADFTARIVVRNILMPLQLLRQKVNWSIVPWCTFTEPEIAHVGMGDKEVRKKAIAYDTYRVRFSDVDRAVAESEEIGFAKILTEKDSDKILGATIAGAHAGELIHEFVMAMNAGIGLGKIASMIHVYPTLAEVARKAADQFNKTRLTPRAKKIFAWLYRRAR